MRDASWQEPLFASIERKTQSRVLSFGRGAISIARALAVRLPEANVTGADPILKRSKLLFGVSFDAIFQTSRLLRRRAVDGFHSPRVRSTKSCWCSHFIIAYLKRSLRLLRKCCCLRHGGTLHVAAYDKPSLPGEQALLAITRYLSGPTAATPTWMEAGSNFSPKQVLPVYDGRRLVLSSARESRWSDRRKPSVAVPLISAAAQIVSGVRSRKGREY